MICFTLLGSAIKRTPVFNFDRCSSCFHLSLHQCGFTKVWQQLPFGLLDICPKVCFYVKHFRFLFILLNSCYSWLRSICEKDEIILMKTEAYIWMPRFKAWTFASFSLRQSSGSIPTLPSQMQIFVRESESEGIRMSSLLLRNCHLRRLKFIQRLKKLLQLGPVVDGSADPESFKRKNALLILHLLWWGLSLWCLPSKRGCQVIVATIPLIYTCSEERVPL